MSELRRLRSDSQRQHREMRRESLVNFRENLVTVLVITHSLLYLSKHCRLKQGNAMI